MVSVSLSYEELAVENAQLQALVAELRDLNHALPERVLEMEARSGQSSKTRTSRPALTGFLARPRATRSLRFAEKSHSCRWPFLLLAQPGKQSTG